jgi:putative component of membrane protein insertase Oxa1/YidC/SpoIIIJ protein YidD
MDLSAILSPFYGPECRDYGPECRDYGPECKSKQSKQLLKY